MITEGPNDPNIFKIVFMAGTPGAGKSTVSKHIKAGTGLKMVNFDDLYEYLKNRKNQGVNFDKVDKMLTNQINTYIDGRLGMIVDKTGQDYGVVSKMKKVFENLGYQTSMVFVNTPLEIAKERVLKRAKETGRDVDPAYIEKAYTNLIQNLGKYQSDFGNNLIIVDNKTGIDVKTLEKNIRKFLSEPITHVAKQWVDNYYDRSRIDEDIDGGKTLKEKCPVAWKHFMNNQSIYKGIKLDKPHFAYDSRKKERRSAYATDNSYMYLTTLNKKWKDGNIPPRNYSVVCSLDKHKASTYGTVYQVFPIGDPDVAIVEASDFWHGFKKIKLGEISEVIDAFAEEVGIKVPSDDHDSIQDFVSYINGIELGVKSLRVSKRNKLIQQYTGWDNIYIELLNAALSGKLLEFLITFVDPDNITVLKLSQMNKSHFSSGYECWFSGKCIFVKDGLLNKKKLVSEDYKGQHESPDKESGSPLHDVTQNDIYPDDFYSNNGLRYYAADDGASVYYSVTHLHNKPNAAITVYRSVPKSVKSSQLNVGDWVSISRAYAKEHGKSHLQGEFKIIKKKVFARDIFTDGNSLEEWGYDPQPVDMIARYKGKIRHITGQIERIKNGEKIIMINKYEDDAYYGKEAEAIKSMMSSVKSYAQKLKDETKDLISEDYPASFSMEEFNAIRSYRGKMKYAAERLKRLGAGSSRVVYQIDDKKVLKLAKNEKGLAQNSVENDGYFNQMDITAKVFDYDDKHDRPYWIEMELAVPIGRKQKKLESLLGLPMLELNAFLQANNPNQRSPENFKRQISQERMDELWEHEYASELIDLVGNIDMEVGDLIRSSSWGSIMRDGKEVPVLIDFGFTNNVRAHYYAR